MSLKSAWARLMLVGFAVATVGFLVPRVSLAEDNPPATTDESKPAPDGPCKCPILRCPDESGLNHMSGACEGRCPTGMTPQCRCGSCRQPNGGLEKQNACTCKR